MFSKRIPNTRTEMLRVSTFRISSLAACLLLYFDVGFSEPTLALSSNLGQPNSRKIVNNIIHVADTGDGSDGQTWATAYTSIADALTAAASGDAIWIKAGVYNEAVTLASGVSLYGGFAGTEVDIEFHLRNWNANPTVIDATGTEAPAISGTAIVSSALDGLVLTGGTGAGLSFLSLIDSEVRNCRVVGNRGFNYGGGISIGDAHETLIVNCVISENSVEGASGEYWGGGMYLGSGQNAVIADCTITNNYASGDGGGVWLGESLSSAPPHFERCLISGNTALGIDLGAVYFFARGGGVYVQSGATFTDCAISGNRASDDGGGVSVRAGAINSCEIIDNESVLGSGGGVAARSFSIIKNCEIEGNRAYDGGGVFASQNTDLADCLISGNHCEEEGGGLRVRDATVTNCRVLHNESETTSGGIHSERMGIILGCEIAENRAPSAGGVFLEADSLARNCLVAGNRATGATDTLSISGMGGGVVSYGSLVNCTISRNSAIGDGSGIVFGDEPGTSPPLSSIVNSIIWGNEGGATRQIGFAEPFAGASITYTDFPEFWNAEGNINLDPQFVNPDAGDFRLLPSSPCIDSASVTGPSTDIDGKPRPIDLPGLGRDRTGDEFDMGAFEAANGPIHVALSGDGSDGQTWATAYTSIADAIAAASSGDDIWIKTGTYNEAITLKSGVSLFGGFAGTESTNDFHLRNWNANPTVIDATGTGAPTVSGFAASNVLDGLTITGGTGGGLSFINVFDSQIQNCRIVGNRSTEKGGGISIGMASGLRIEACTISDNSVEGTFGEYWGGGMYLGRGANTVILDCTITNNLATGDGGGVCLGETLSFPPPHFERCLIAGNTATSEGINLGPGNNARGGGVYLQSHATFVDCEIANNTASSFGGGMQIQSATVENCFIHGNRAGESGGGLDIDQFTYLLDCEIANNESATFGGGFSMDPQCRASGCIVRDNSASYAGGFHLREDSEMVNCLVYGNQTGGAGKGGALEGSGGGGVTFGSLLNCTVTENSAAGDGSGLAIGFDEGSPVPTVTSSIVWGNVGTGNQIALEASATVQITYSDIQGGWPGEGNLDADPLFLDPPNGNFNLRVSSPCVDTAATAGPAEDVLGVGRPVDIPGAGRDGTGDEFDRGAFEALKGPIHVALSGNGAGGETWATAYTSLADALTAAASGDSIWIKTGTYNEAIILKSGVSLYGGFDGTEANDEFNHRNWNAYPTVIDATGIPKPVISGGFGSTESLAIDGLVVTGGSGGEELDEAGGGGISLLFPFDFHIRNCRIVRNRGILQGGGISLGGPLDVVIENCAITENTGVGQGGDRGGDFVGGGLFISRALGEVRILDCSITNNHSKGDGGGIYLGDSILPGPYLERCYIANNTAFLEDSGGVVGRTERGGGVYLHHVATFVDCEIANNRCGGDGGGLLIEDATLTNCYIHGNHAGGTGGGVEVDQYSKLEGCLITGNHAGVRGGGFSMDNYCVADSCRVLNNTAPHAGGFYLLYDSEALNCLVARNQAAETSKGNTLDGMGGGVVSFSPLLNCTITDNTAAGNGSGLVFGNRENRPIPSLANSIVWGNEGAGQQVVLAEATAEVQITYSDIQGGWPGMGNLDADPLFVDAGAGNFRLTACSPCVDRGGPNGPAFDLEGTERPLDILYAGSEGTGAEFDMGAYEADPEVLGPCTIDFGVFLYPAGGGEPVRYETLGEAALDTGPGDEIVINRAEYLEAPVVLSVPNVTLRGERGATLHDDTNFPSGRALVEIQASASGCRIEGLRFDSSGGIPLSPSFWVPMLFETNFQGTIGIANEAEGTVIANCLIEQFRAGGFQGAGAVLAKSGSLLVDGCSFHENNTSIHQTGGVLQALNCEFEGQFALVDVLVHDSNAKGIGGGSLAQTQIVDSTFADTVIRPFFRVFSAGSPSDLVMTGCRVGTAILSGIHFGDGHFSLVGSVVYSRAHLYNENFEGPSEYNYKPLTLGSLYESGTAGIPTVATIDHCDLFNHGRFSLNWLFEGSAKGVIQAGEIPGDEGQAIAPCHLTITNSIISGVPEGTADEDTGIVFSVLDENGPSGYSVSNSALALGGRYALGAPFEGIQGTFSNVGTESPHYANVGNDIPPPNFEPPFTSYDFHYSANSQAATLGTDGGPIGAYGPDESRGVTLSVPTEVTQRDGLINLPFEINDASGVAQVEVELTFAGNLTALSPILGDTFSDGTLTSQGSNTHKLISLLADPVQLDSASEILFVLPLLASDEAMSTSVVITAATVTEVGGRILRYQALDGEITINVNLIPGDVDFSERIDVRDVASVLRHIVGIEKLSALGTMAADVVDPGVLVPPDFTDSIGIDDALAIYMQVSGETNGTE